MAEGRQLGFPVAIVSTIRYVIGVRRKHPLPKLLPPWQKLAADGVKNVEKEAELELADGHPLFGLTLQALCYSEAGDDFLFATSDPDMPYAVVHLTWKHPDKPPWPASGGFTSLEDWATQCMAADHRDWNEE